MAAKPSLTSLRLDLLVLALLLTAAAAVYLHLNPVLIDAIDTQVEGIDPPPPPPRADALLLLPDRPASPAASFDDVDMAMGWFNLAVQEQGSARTTTPSALTPGDLEASRLLIVPASVAPFVDPTAIQRIGAWVDAGGVLLVEQPDVRWSTVTLLPIGRGKARTTRRITAADGAPMRGAMRDSLLDAPLLTTMIPIRGPGLDAGMPREGIEPLMEVDGRPALIHTWKGDGHVYTLTVDMARAVMTLQQGRPNDDLSVNRPDDLPGLPPDATLPSNLVAHTKLHATATPYADLLERNLMEVASMHTPIPRLWYFPDSYAGAYVLTHDEERFGDRALFLSDWEAAQGRRATVFALAPSLSRAALERLTAQGHDVQLMWGRGWDGALVVARGGVGPWRPLQHKLTLAPQRFMLADRLPDLPVIAARAEHSAIDTDWASTFQKLAAADLLADTTYGPTHPKEYGYLFGTGLPFYPLDRAGRLLPIAEIPTVLRDDAEDLPERHRRLLRASAAGFHQLIVVNFRARTMARTPSVDTYAVWKEAADQAARYNHWVTTLRDYLAFEQARRSSTLTSRFVARQRRLEITAEVVAPQLPPLPPKPGAPADAPPILQGVPSIAFPQAYQGASVEAVRLDGENVPIARIPLSGDSFFHILKVAPGAHTVHVNYEGRVGE